MEANGKGDHQANLAETIEQVRTSTGAYIDSWPDRMSPEALRRKVSSWRKNTSPLPQPESLRAFLLGKEPA